MNIAIILASGSGTRLKSSKIPKQFIEIKGKPILIHTLETFLSNKNIEKIIIVCKSDWVRRCKEYIIKHFFNEKDNIYIVKGGESRNQSILNGLNFIKKEIKPNKNDIIITHDSVRMFVNNRIIDENISESKKSNNVINTCVKSIDTLVVSKGNKIVNSIPNRDLYYNGQTPQTAKFNIIEKIYSNKFSKNIFNNTDLCKLAEILNIPIKIVDGDYYNIKITTDFDLFIANLLEVSNE